MHSDTQYQDNRAQFFKEIFNSALSYDEYVRTGEEKHQRRWADFATHIKLSAAEQKLIGSFTRKMNVLVMSGIWCGDCARQGPMLRAIEQASPLLTFRYIDNKKHTALQEELRLNGAEKVPVVVSLSEDFFEIGRFGDRHLSVYRRKAAREFGPACDPGIVSPTTDELAAELSEWVSYFERLQLMLRLSPLLRKRHGD